MITQDLTRLSSIVYSCFFFFTSSSLNAVNTNKYYLQAFLFMTLYFLVSSQLTDTITSNPHPSTNPIHNQSQHLMRTPNATTENSEPTLRDIFVVEFHVFPFIFMVGTMCNILTFIVMRRKRMRHQSTYFYMAVLAIADELVLINGCLNFWMYLYTSKMLVIMSAILCKVVCVAFYATLHFSVWMVVIMTIERFIAVTYPLQASSWCTVKRAKMATILLALIIFGINFHFIFTHTLISRRDEPAGCQSTSETFDFFIDKIWPWIDASVYSFVPLFLLIIFNILIVHNLLKASKKIRRMNNSVSHKTTVSMRDRGARGFLCWRALYAQKAPNTPNKRVAYDMVTTTGHG